MIYCNDSYNLGDHSVNIRRLSTASWVKASPGDSFGTRWTWYWRNDQEQWVPYDRANLPVSNTAQNSSSNEILEEHYLSGMCKLSRYLLLYVLWHKNALFYDKTPPQIILNFYFEFSLNTSSILCNL
jgi:hypothetical protein